MRRPCPARTVAHGSTAVACVGGVSSRASARADRPARSTRIGRPARSWCRVHSTWTDPAPDDPARSCEPACVGRRSGGVVEPWRRASASEWYVTRSHWTMPAITPTAVALGRRVRRAAPQDSRRQPGRTPALRGPAGPSARLDHRARERQHPGFGPTDSRASASAAGGPWICSSRRSSSVPSRASPNSCPSRHRRTSSSRRSSWAGQDPFLNSATFDVMLHGGHARGAAGLLLARRAAPRRRWLGGAAGALARG